MDDIDLQDLLDRAVEEVKSKIANSEIAAQYVDEWVKQSTQLDPDEAHTEQELETIAHATDSAWKSLIANAIMYW